MTNEPIVNILPRFIDDLKAKHRSPATILAYRADLDQLIMFASAKNKALPEHITKEDIEGFRDWLLSQKYTPKSTSRKLNAVKTFFRWLVTQKIILVDPSKDVAHPKLTASAPKFLTQLEYRALRDIVRADRRIATIVEVILQTGLRISEVANMKIENFKDGSLIIESYATQPSRTLPLNKLAKLALETYLKDSSN